MTVDRIVDHPTGAGEFGLGVGYDSSSEQIGRTDQ